MSLIKCQSICFREIIFLDHNPLSWFTSLSQDSSLFLEVNDFGWLPILYPFCKSLHRPLRLVFQLSSK